MGSPTTLTPEASAFIDAYLSPPYNRAFIEERMRAIEEAAARDALDRVRAAVEYRLTVGLRHVPGATEREERFYNDGQAFGLRHVLAILEPNIEDTQLELVDGTAYRVKENA